LAARLYSPAGRQADDDGLIVFFPPGGFVRVEMEAVDPFMRLLARHCGLRILVPDYTAANRLPFPAAAEDAHAILAWTVHHCAELGWNGKMLIVAGIEAGGNLAAVSALMARDRGEPSLAAQIMIMPMLDPDLSSCSMRMSCADAAARAADACAAGYRDYLPRPIDRAHPYAAPLQSSRMKDLPPALILSAEDDPLRDEAELYGAKLAAANIRTVVKRMPLALVQDAGARCSCIRKEDALQAITAFLAGLGDAA
jgi:acetyl esterase/lipase